jgi:hypothetical protein
VVPLLLSSGPNKPSNLEFLEDSIEQLNEICDNGISLNGKILQVITSIFYLG